jgi:hypothetical protein
VLYAHIVCTPVSDRNLHSTHWSFHFNKYMSYLLCCIAVGLHPTVPTHTVNQPSWHIPHCMSITSVYGPLLVGKCYSKATTHNVSQPEYALLLVGTVHSVLQMAWDLHYGFQLAASLEVSNLQCTHHPHHPGIWQCFNLTAVAEVQICCTAAILL